MRTDPRIDSPVVVPMMLMTPVAAAAISVPVLGSGAVIAAAVGLAAGLLVGAPALWLARRRGLTGFWSTVTLGAAVGLLSVALCMAFFAVLDGRLPSVRWAVVAITVLAGLAGAMTGALYSAVHDVPRVSLRRVGVVWGVAWLVPIMAAAWPEDAWPSRRERTEIIRLQWAYGTALDEADTREVLAWRSDRPQCVASIYLPALLRQLETTHPREFDVEIVRIARIGRAGETRIVRLGDSLVEGPTTFIQGCRVW